MTTITMRRPLVLSATMLCSSLVCWTHGFTVAPFLLSSSSSTLGRFRSRHIISNNGQVGSGSNWIERSFPVDVTGSGSGGVKKVDDYNLGINGKDFQVGPLSKRMYDAIMTRNFEDGMGEDIKMALKLYAMDFTAKEATRAALKQNGLELIENVEEEEEEEDTVEEGMWGDVHSIQLLDLETDEPVGPVFDSTEDAAQEWTPGQTFNFVVRQVPAKLQELSLDELLQALDPKGELREQAEQSNLPLPDEDAILQANDISSLADLSSDVIRRSENVPRDARTEIHAFSGLNNRRGYRVIHASDLSRDSVNADGSENQKTLMHVMDALVSHGALVVDLTDGGCTYNQPTQMKHMWDTLEALFDSNDDLESKLPPMTSVVGSHAKVGYGNYDNGSMQFLETRWKRDGDLLPTEAKDILGEAGVDSLKQAFDIVCNVGKDVVRIVTAAAGMEVDAFSDDDDDDDDDDDKGDVLASKAATRLVDELVDDGKSIGTTGITPEEGPISMSSHRLCRYANKKTKNGNETATAVEIFGAHTDSSFITAVPVAAVSGLEVYDEAEEKWYRPELAARLHWQEERSRRGLDPTADTESLNDIDMELPWHARYVVLVPGEFLQIVSRNEVPAAVHRVVAVSKGPARLSAPILLRGRPGTKLDVSRYLGQAGDSRLLQECNGKTMDEIHNAMQPFQ